MNDLEIILEKIDNETLKLSEFNDFIRESVASSIQQRIRNRVDKSVRKPHQTRDGHQKLGNNNFTSRVTPKRKPKNKQSHGRAKLGRKHAAEELRDRYE